MLTSLIIGVLANPPTEPVKTNDQCDATFAATPASGGEIAVRVTPDAYNNCSDFRVAESRHCEPLSQPRHCQVAICDALFQESFADMVATFTHEIMHCLAVNPELDPSTLGRPQGADLSLSLEQYPVLVTALPQPLR